MAPQYPVYPYAPPPKKDDSSTIIIIIVVVLVVIFLVLPLVLFFLIAGVVQNLPPPGEVHPTVTLAPGTWSGLHSTIVVTSVSTPTIDVLSLTFQVTAANGTIYYSGSGGPGPPVNGVVVTVTFNDVSSNGRVGPDDNIALSVDSAAGLTQIHGCTFRVLIGADVLGTATLP
jgi:hypothetical protein